MGEEGNITQSESICLDLIRKCTLKEQTNTRIAALGIEGKKDIQAVQRAIVTATQHAEGKDESSKILDNTASIYKNLKEYQYHGSVYGVIPAKRGYLKPVGEWNSQEVIAKGPNIKVVLNGAIIVDGNIEEAGKNGTIDGRKHPGLKQTKGHIGFLGHGSVVRFRNIRIKNLINSI